MHVCAVAHLFQKHELMLKYILQKKVLSDRSRTFCSKLYHAVMIPFTYYNIC